MRWWPFSKTYRVRCPDGSVKTVYKNLSHAFPFHIPGFKGKLSATSNISEGFNTDMKAEYATAIHGLLYQLDELNQGLMMTFRGAYVVYQNDPCEHAPFFEREVEKVLEEQKRFRICKLQIDGLIQLAKLKPESAEEFSKSIREVANSIGIFRPELTSEKISESRNLAKKMAV